MNSTYNASGLPVVSQHTVCIYTCCRGAIVRGFRFRRECRGPCYIFLRLVVPNSFQCHANIDNSYWRIRHKVFRYSYANTMYNFWIYLYFSCCHKILRDDLRDHWTNHKLRKKQANQKRLHMSMRLCGIRTRYCALIRRRSIQAV